MTKPFDPHSVLNEHFISAVLFERYAWRGALITYIGCTIAVAATILVKWKPSSPGAFEGHRLAAFVALLISAGFLATAASAIAFICTHQRKLCQSAFASIALIEGNND